MATAKKPAVKLAVDNTVKKSPATPKPAAKTAKPLTKDEVKKLPLPKTLAACADELYTTRQARFALDKQVDALKAREAQLSEELINKLPKSQASGIAGKVARATIETKTVCQVVDWDKVNGYILKNAKKNPGVFALYQRRIGESAVKEMWEAGREVPGVEPMDIPRVSLNKL